MLHEAQESTCVPGLLHNTWPTLYGHNVYSLLDMKKATARELFSTKQG